MIRRRLYLVPWGRKGYSNPNKTKFKLKPHFPKAPKRGIETWEPKKPTLIRIIITIIRTGTNFQKMYQEDYQNRILSFQEIHLTTKPTSNKPINGSFILSSYVVYIYIYTRSINNNNLINSTRRVIINNTVSQKYRYFFHSHSLS